MNCLTGYENRSYSQGRICFSQWDGEIKGKRVTVVVTGLGEFFFVFSLLTWVPDPPAVADYGCRGFGGEHLGYWLSQWMPLPILMLVLMVLIEMTSFTVDIFH
jgi:hypothetical protein